MKPEDKRLYVKKLRSCMNSGFYGIPSGATKLFDFLYLAGEDEATNVHLLSELGITHVINCAAGYNCFILPLPVLLIYYGCAVYRYQKNATVSKVTVLYTVGLLNIIRSILRKSLHVDEISSRSSAYIKTPT